MNNTPRKGRLPAFFRHEADEIIADGRKVSAVAKQWGVSFITIQRVKSIGPYAGVPYVARDEEQPAATASGVTRHNKPGPHFKSGRAPLTDAEKQAISNDTRKTRHIAAAYGISVQAVNTVRASVGVTPAFAVGITLDTAYEIRDSAITDVECMNEYNVPLMVITRIRNGEFFKGFTPSDGLPAEVTPEEMVEFTAEMEELLRGL